MHSQLSSHSAEPVELANSTAALRLDTGGPYALLVPGYTGSKEDFAPLLDEIAGAGLSPVAIDLPGQMDTPGPADESAYLPEVLGAFVASLIATLDRPVLLLGHSYGGLVARRAVLAGARVVGLTLLSTGPAELPTGPRRHILDLAEALLRDQGVAAVHRGLEAMNAANPRWLAQTPQVREFLRLRFLRNRAEALLGMGTGLRQEPDLVADLARTLRTTNTPSLVTCGAQDDAWPPTVQRDMADRLEADFATIESAAHSPAIENPDGLLATLLPTWKTWLG
ncbi:alpha/beta fold hydrolase [Actinokineospora diospyrosa]|uniref:Pimeloyl-ACP methyl ester carboxylesterase n=1 Tax=Actinokineospora diospyrosa TaxID=103728 RepID=A0ABT1IMI9_9PSEU|nr:alpha/beta hydrolase [Actinokineospora diospyrosa]MCP2273406.1 Pimeloyl-ACP methyl ester carboxylesterase [Actinokineospora diospyrosa]